jgi:hypothetical protein
LQLTRSETNRVIAGVAVDDAASVRMGEISSAELERIRADLEAAR